MQSCWNPCGSSSFIFSFINCWICCFFNHGFGQKHPKILRIDQNSRFHNWRAPMHVTWGQRSSSRHIFTNFLNTNLRFFFLPNTIEHMLWFSQIIKTEKKNNCFEQQGFFSFSTEKYWWKIRRFVWWKFVKTCRELNNSCGYYWNRSDWQEMCPKDFWTCLQSLMLWCLPSKWLDQNHSQRWICPTWTTFSRGNKFNNNF